MNFFLDSKKRSKTRIIVAMSGGVDSSVAAALLKEEGYDVIGITMHLYDTSTISKQEKKKICCLGRDSRDAKKVAEQIGIPHYILNYEDRFQAQVINDFIDTYAKGRTPIPCVRCNQRVKFHDLLKTTRHLSGDILATGHYVNWKKGKNGPELHRASDVQKDQSYFLFTITKDQLPFLRFPLGKMTKDETRKQASRLGLEVANKPESQDICFVPHGNYVEFIRKLRPHALVEGDIVHTNGQVLGRHKGLAHFTIGQRRGLGIQNGNTTPFYVTKIDVDSNCVTVGSKLDLQCNFVSLRETNLLMTDRDLRCSKRQVHITVKLRSSQDPVPSCLTLLEDGVCFVELLEPAYGISPGQACVFYKETRVLGGGWIEKATLV